MYWNCNQKEKGLYIIKFYVYFLLAGYIDGLSFTDPKAHMVKTAVCNIIVLIRYLSSHIVLNLKIYETRKSVDGEPSHIPALIKANRIEASYFLRKITYVSFSFLAPKT